uniref:Uncharacterized protein n=1 Tax=Setaria italica TaxID=4555 RepID=K4AH69_SETIT
MVRRNRDLPSDPFGCSEPVQIYMLYAEATDTTFSASVKAEQWQDINIESPTDLCLFIIVDHEKLQSWMHPGKLMYLCGHEKKRYYINMNLCKT